MQTVCLDQLTACRVLLQDTWNAARIQLKGLQMNFLQPARLQTDPVNDSLLNLVEHLAAEETEVSLWSIKEWRERTWTHVWF